MEGRFEARCGELLDQACVKVEDWQEVLAQLKAFAKPFSETLVESAQRRHLVEYIAGLLSTLERKTSEGIAYLYGQDRKQLQQFIGESPWEYAPLIREIIRVGERIFEPDGVIIFDPSAFAKRGRSRSVWRGSGVVGWARSTAVRWGSTWAMCRGRNTP